jgi:3-deoxy-manno-octulosonate cytidylyltransferase (CMP-KDO synthetase)
MIGDKTLLEWTWRAASDTGLPVFVATDDERIFDAVRAFGAGVVMTGDCRNGTERCAIANEVIGADLVINWQGDSPLLDPAWAKRLAEHMCRNPQYACGTIGILRMPHIGMVSVECRKDGCAFGFRRCEGGEDAVLMHVGLYAYWASSLRQYIAATPPAAETEHGLEQLRWRMDMMTVLRLQVPTWPVYEVNNPPDVQLVSDVLRHRDATARP